MSDTSGFLSCPFCGSEELEIKNLSTSVRCRGCGVMCTISTSMIAAAGAGKEGRLANLRSCWNKRI